MANADSSAIVDYSNNNSSTITSAKPSFDDSKHITALPSIITTTSSGESNAPTIERSKERKLTKRIGSGAKLVRSGVAGVTGGSTGFGDHLHHHYGGAGEKR